MLRILRPLTAAIMLSVSACGGGASTEVLSEELEAQLTLEVEAAANSWWSAWRTMDFETGMSFISERPEAVWVGDDGIIYGKAQMREAWRDWAAGIRDQSNDRVDVRYVILTSNVAYVTLRFANAVATRPTGEVLPERSFMETLVWVKEEGTWRIIAGHESAARESWQTILDLR
jgi:uncharacterized protein (TIGR02246 family)